MPVFKVIDAIEVQRERNEKYAELLRAEGNSSCEHARR